MKKQDTPVPTKFIKVAGYVGSSTTLAVAVVTLFFENLTQAKQDAAIILISTGINLVLFAIEMVLTGEVARYIKRKK